MDDEGAQNKAACKQCPAAQYCEEASSAPQNCPAGTFSDATGEKSVSRRNRILPCYQGELASFHTVMISELSLNMF